VATPAIHAGDVHCSFSTGFASIAQAIPDQVGGCLSQPVALGTGDVVQQTTEGQMVWYKSNSISEFTNAGLGTTWVLGPFGLQSRPSNQTFSYEAPQSQVAGVTIVGPQAPSQSLAGCMISAINADGAASIGYVKVQLPFSNANC